MANTTKSRMVIRFNKERAGVELVIPDGRRLTSDELSTIKSLGFIWHKKSKYWYTRYSDEKWELIKASCIGKDAQLPAVKETKLIKQMAVERKAREEEKAKSKPKSKKPTKTEQFDELAAKVDKLAELVFKMAEMQQVSK